MSFAYPIFLTQSFVVEKEGEDSSRFKYKLNAEKTLLKPLKLQDVVILEVNVISIIVIP